MSDLFCSSPSSKPDARATVSGALGLSGQASEWITPIIANLPFAGAFGLAFLLGFKAG